jgi:glyoxylase I family protein
MNETIRGGGFHHVTVRAYDYDAALKFYTEGLGFKRVHGWGLDGRAKGEPDSRVSLLDSGGGDYLELFAGRTKAQADNGDDALLHVAFRTDDCDAALERARAAGATVTMEPASVIPDNSDRPIEFRIAFVKGPGGELVEFFQCPDL